MHRFWSARHAAAHRQRASGSPDRGNRQEVTAGGHMDGFVDLVVETVLARGAARPGDIRRGRRTTVLPGWFRPHKAWDLLVVKGSRLGAAIELKAHVGPSYGNNFNNRCEELVGNATDFRAAHDHGLFGPGPRPWLGYLFLLEDDDATRRAVRGRPTVFGDGGPATTYIQRYGHLLDRLVRTGLCDAAALIVSPRPGDPGRVRWRTPVPGLTIDGFVDSLVDHLRSI